MHPTEANSNQKEQEAYFKSENNCFFVEANVQVRPHWLGVISSFEGASGFQFPSNSIGSKYMCKNKKQATSNLSDHNQTHKT